MKHFWRKLGLIYCPDQSQTHEKLSTHAANPLPIHLYGDVYRVMYSARDALNRSSVGAVDIDIIKRKTIQVHRDPLFTFGSEGSFFCDGVGIGNCYRVDDKEYLVFMGWQAPAGKHWRGDIGRLLLDRSFALRLDPVAPLLKLDEIDPISVSYPFVLHCKDGLYRMWYGSTISWTSSNGEMVHVINCAISYDGHTWIKKGLAVPYQIGVAQAFSRPTVIEDCDGFHMWFSYRSGSGQTYRIGYASSQNGDAWDLKLDQMTMSNIDLGWDDQMQEYPFVIEHTGAYYMLYNGNGYGLTGIGLAVLETIR
jgi:hypothetical protein